jgi:hypothetical protein
MIKRWRAFSEKCTVSIRVEYVEFMAVPMPYSVSVKMSQEAKLSFIVQMLVVIAFVLFLTFWGVKP